MTPADALLREDERSRARALALESFIVEAPAGAGKTELLTQRVLRLLAVVDEPEEIVAITFTNKAAAEMQSRIVASLARAASGEPPVEAHKRITFDLARAALAAGERHGWRLMENPGRLRILTIDALCASLARQMPLLSRFGGEPRLAETPQRHYDEATRRTLALVEADDGTGAAVAEALRHLDNDVGRLSGLLADMLARRDQWLPHTVGERLREEAEAALAALISRDVEAAAAQWDAGLQQRLLPLARFAAANVDAASPLAPLLDWSAPLAGVPEELPVWRALGALLLTGEGAVRKQLNKTIGFPAGKEYAAQKAGMVEFLANLPQRTAQALARVRGLPAPAYDNDEWRVVAAFSRLLKVAAAQLWTVFNEAGEADFVEVAQRALLALGDEGAPTDLALSLDYRIRHLLVDEFQDTSPTQVELLRRLTAGWSPDDGRTLFAVGDPMQSIYRFRKADVGLFLRVAEKGIGGLPLERLRLARNNRSCPAVVAWVNQRFADVFPAADEAAAGAIRYRPFVPTRTPLAGEGVFVRPVIVPADDPAADADLLEAREVLAIIDAVRREDPQRRIAVLVRARRHLDALVGAIRRAGGGLRFQAVEIECLAARQPVQDLLSVTRALHHRADRLHWLAILRAPWCGLTLADLHALAGDDHRSTLWQLMHDEPRLARLSADGRARLLHVRGAMAEAFAHRGRTRVRRWVEGVWMRLGGASCLAGAGDAADARAFLDLIDALDAGGRFSLEELERGMAELYAAPDAADGGENLQFMTIHKSKGLEFDTVIVPGLHRSGRNGDSPLVLWEEVVADDPSETLVAAPLRRRGAEAGQPSLYDYLRRLEKERCANEDARALYVAATRAVRALYLVGVATPRADGTLAPDAGTYLRFLWDGVAAEFAAAAERDAPESAAAPDDASAAAQEAPIAFVPKLVRVAVPPSVAQPSRTPAAAPAAEGPVGTGDALAAHVGTLVHAYLELVARDGLEAWPSQRLRALRPAMRGWLRQQGHLDAEAERGAGLCLEMLEVTLASEAGRWVLKPRAESGAEMAWSVGEGSRIATRVVDRCFVENGERWIIDYKTVRIDAASLAAHAEGFRSQLDRYAALFEGGEPVRLAVFYVASGRLVELRPVAPE